MNEEVLRHITALLLEWYDVHKRTLPWRDQQNAYYTWISEIMLQQTRVEAVKPYFARFVQELPDIRALADCTEDKLLKLWEGLGYYNRVRNMQKAAIQVMEEYEGQLPRDYQKLRELRGIGNYTAGAIASIAYGIPVPAVDGNVLRVISRLTDYREDIMKQSTRRKVEELLLKIMPEDRPGDYNQALMELGAVVCVPNGAPDCEHCPLEELCTAHSLGCQEELPVKAAKKPRRIEYRTVLVIQDGEYTALRRRAESGLLAGLYELPNEEGHLTGDEAAQWARDRQLDPLQVQPLAEAKHIFSHVEWRMIGYRIRVAALESACIEDMVFVSRKERKDKYPVPSAFAAYSGYIKEDMIK